MLIVSQNSHETFAIEKFDEFDIREVDGEWLLSADLKGKNEGRVLGLFKDKEKAEYEFRALMLSYAQGEKIHFVKGGAK